MSHGVAHTEDIHTADRSQTHQPTTIPDGTVQQEERINSSHIDVLWDERPARALFYL